MPSAHSLSITHTDKSASGWPALLKWVATGDSSILPWVMSNLRPFILLWSGYSDSPTYWKPHLLHSIKKRMLLGLHKACILDGKLSASSFVEEQICGLQYGASFAMASTAREVARGIFCVQCQSCMHKQITKIFLGVGRRLLVAK